MVPFVLELTLGLRYMDFYPVGSDLSVVEAITSFNGLIVNLLEVCADAAYRVGLLLESYELRMMPVTGGFILQDFLSQQAFSPQCHQAGGVQIFWMKGPEAHG
jgi:hypothetical protein